jgi:DNA-binding NtrC family response regulator
VGELPLGTQARLLRILENGEFIKVGSSQVQKTDVRLVAATNRDLLERAHQGKFREDLYYRLATVPLRVPKLAERKQDIYLLFRKFSQDFAEQHHRQPIDFTIEAQEILAQYPWPGNIRQLKNITEQICVLETENFINEISLQKYLPPIENQLPILLGKNDGSYDGLSERDIFYKVLVDLRRDVNDLKKVVFGFLDNNENPNMHAHSSKSEANSMPLNVQPISDESLMLSTPVPKNNQNNNEEIQEVESETYQIISDDNLSLEAKEIELIKRALNRNLGKRKKAADDLGISERTLYRKIKQYELE